MTKKCLSRAEIARLFFIVLSFLLSPFITLITTAKGVGVMKICNGVLEKVNREDINNNGVFYVPNEVFKIGDYAFKNCVNLSEIRFSDSVVSIGINAFENTGIKEVLLPNGLISVEPCTFENCKRLERVFIPDNIKIIKDAAFFKCSEVSDIHIGNSVIEIGNWAFCECQNLQQIALPDSVQRIGFASFKDCIGLAQIKLSKHLKRLGYYSFSACNNLEAIMLPDSLEYIGDGAFESCKSLKTIQVGLRSKLKNINDFDMITRGCNKFEGVTLYFEP